MFLGNHAAARKNSAGDWYCDTCGGEAADFELFEDFGKLADCHTLVTDPKVAILAVGEEKPETVIGSSAGYGKAIEELREKRDPNGVIFDAIMADLDALKSSKGLDGVEVIGAEDGAVIFKDSDGRTWKTGPYVGGLTPVPTGTPTPLDIEPPIYESVESEGFFKRITKTFRKKTT